MLFRRRYRPLLAPSAGLEQVADDGKSGWRVTGPECHFLLQGPLPSGWVKIKCRTWAEESAEFRLFARMPGPGTHESDFSIGLVDSEEKWLSAYVLLNEGTLQARIVPSGTSLPFSIRDVTLNRVSRLEILAAAVFRFIVGHNASPRLLRTMFAQFLAILRAGGFSELRSRLGRFVESQVDRRDNYRFWVLQNTPQEAELSKLSAKCTRLPYKPIFSLLVSISDSDEQSLRRCIRSIVSQVYPLWELWLVMPDAAPCPAETLLEEFRDFSPRIKVLCGTLQEPTSDIESRMTGDFVCAVHSDAVLAPEALGECALFLNDHPDADALYSDEDRIDAQNNRFQPFFKPDWSPEYLESFPYISSLSCYRTSIVRKTCWLRNTDRLAIDYDLALRFSELAQNIAHIPKVLYHRYVSEREESNHTGNAIIDCLKGHLKRVGIGGTVTESPYPGLLDVRYDIAKNPLVSIIIPAGGRKANIRGVTTDLLSNCITSLRNRSVYKNYEIIVVHDNNLEQSVLRLIEDSKGKLVPFRDKFNFSAKVNLGAHHAQGEHLLILNDDTEVRSAEWLSAMLEFSQRKAIGAVGAKLYFEDGTIQHAGVTFTREGFPHHIYRGHPDSLPGYFYSLVASHNCLAVTGACLMTRTEVFHEVGGFNEEMAVNYNDIDYCFKVIEAGYRIVFTPRARLFHFESKSRLNTVEQREMDHFERLWHSKISLDPYYNVNLEPNPSFFEVKIRP